MWHERKLYLFPRYQSFCHCHVPVSNPETKVVMVGNSIFMGRINILCPGLCGRALSGRRHWRSPFREFRRIHCSPLIQSPNRPRPN